MSNSLRKTSVRARHGKINRKEKVVQTDEGFEQPPLPYSYNSHDHAYKEHKWSSPDLAPAVERQREANIQRELKKLRREANERLDQLLVKMNHELKNDDDKRAKIRQTISSHKKDTERKYQKMNERLRSPKPMATGTVSVGPPIEGLTWKMFEHFMCLVVAIHSSRNMAGRLAAVNIYLSAELGFTIGDTLVDCKEYAVQFVTKMFKDASPELFTKKFFGDILKMSVPAAGNAKFFATSGKDIRSMPLYMEATRLCGTLFYMIISTKFGTLSASMVDKLWDLKDFAFTGNVIMDVINWCTSLLDGVDLYRTTGDWKDIFRANSLSRWAHDVDMACSAAAEICITPDMANCRDDSIQTCEAYIVEGKEKLLDHAPGSISYVAINKLLEKLKGAIEVVKRSKISSRVRPSPFAIQVQGSVGIGKTYTAHMLMSEIMLAYGHLPAEDLIWTINNEKFDSSLTATKKVYFMDDISCIKPISGVVPSHLKVITMCNFAAGFAEMPGVEDKGKLMYTPDALVCTSNQINMDADSYFNTPAAYLRRWKFVVTVVVDPVICSPRGSAGKTAIDHAKIPHGKSIDSYQYFAIKMRVPNGSDSSCDLVNVDSTGFDFPEGGSAEYMGVRLFRMDEMIKVIRRYIDRHIETSKFVVADVDRVYAAARVRFADEAKSVKVVATTSITQLPRTVYQYMFTMWTVLYLYVCAMVGSRVRAIKMAPVHYIDDVLLETEKLIHKRAIYYKNRVDEYVQPLIKGLKMLAALAVAGVLYKLWNVFYGPLQKKVLSRFVKHQDGVKATMMYAMKDRTVDVTYPEATSSPVMYPRDQKYGRPKAVPRPMGYGKPQGATSSLKFEDKVRLQSVTLTYATDDGRAVIGNGLHVKTNYVLTCWHNVSKLATGEIEILELSGSLDNSFIWKKVVTITANQIYRIPNRDLCYIYIPQLTPVFDLSKFMVCPGDTDVPLTSEAEVGVYQKNAEGAFEYKVKLVTHLRPEHAEYDVLGTVYKSRLAVGKTVDDFVPGNSGAICIQKAYNRLIGVQVATSHESHEGLIEYLCPLTKEIQDTINPRFTEVPDYVPPPVDLIEKPGKGSIASHVVGSACVLMGSIPNYVHLPDESDFRMSKAAQFLAGPEENGVIKTPDGKEFSFPILNRRIAKTDVPEQENVFVDPYLVSTAKISESPLEPHMELVDKAFTDYIKPLEKIPAVKSGPLDLFQVVNGIDTINPLNIKTSAGYPLLGKKSKYFESYMELDGTQRKRLLPEYVLEYEAFKRQVFDNTEPMSIFKMHLKDEMTTPKKVAEGRERAFMGGPMYLTMATREYCGPCMDFIAKHSDEFECVVGINVGGPAWKDLGDNLKRYRYKNAGDVRHFDKTHCRIVLRYFVPFMEKIADKLGYTPAQKRMMTLLIYRQIFYYCIVKGDLFAFFRSFCSGSVLTTFMNSFCMSLYIRIAWYMNFEDEEFRDFNWLSIFGDDNIGGTNEVEFDFYMIQRSLAVWGIEYTPATKDDKAKSFLDYEELTFLKRRFVDTKLTNGEGKEVAVTLCPLEESSIWKSLMFTDSDPAEQDSILASCIIDAHLQFFMFGREKFEIEKLRLQDLTDKLGYRMPEEGHLRWRKYEEVVEDYLNNQLRLYFT